MLSWRCVKIPTVLTSRQLGISSKVRHAWSDCSLQEKNGPHCGDIEGRHLKDRMGGGRSPLFQALSRHFVSIFENKTQLKRGAVRVRPHRTICLPRRDGALVGYGTRFPDDFDRSKTCRRYGSPRREASIHQRPKDDSADMIEGSFCHAVKRDIDNVY